MTYPPIIIMYASIGQYAYTGIVQVIIWTMNMREDRKWTTDHSGTRDLQTISSLFRFLGNPPSSALETCVEEGCWLKWRGMGVNRRVTYTALKPYMGGGGSPCRMSIIRNGDVALLNLRIPHVVMLILRNCHVSCHYLFKSPDTCR